MNKYQKLLTVAQAKGWKTPINDVFPDSAWANYWLQCIAYEKNPDAGRPVVPHRPA